MEQGREKTAIGNMPSAQVYHLDFTPEGWLHWRRQRPNRDCSPPSRTVAPVARLHSTQHASSSDQFRRGQIRRAADPRSTPSAVQDWRRPCGKGSRPAAQSCSASKPRRRQCLLRHCQSAQQQLTRAGCDSQTPPGQHSDERTPFHHATGQRSRRRGAPDLFRVWCLSGFDQTSC